MVQPKEMGRRVRTARTYGGLSRVQLGEHLGISEEGVKRMERGTLPRKIKPSELLMIAHATGVPLWFLVEGWPTKPPDEGFADEIERPGPRTPEHDPRPDTETHDGQADTPGR